MPRNTRLNVATEALACGEYDGLFSDHERQIAASRLARAG
jgi:hypothetical protein